MASISWRDWRHPVEFALLLALVFFLPLREAPKNIFWLLYVLAWVIERVRAGDAGGRLDIWDALIGGLIATGYLAAAFGGVQRGDGNEWRAVNDIWRYGLLFMCVRRGNYDDAQKLLLLAVLVGACVVAEIEAIWRWKVTGARRALELVSVGQVNHSAIYLTICLGIACALLAGRWRALATPARAALGVAVLALLSGLFLGGSRAAGATAIVLLLAAALVAAKSAHIGRLAWLAAALSIGIAALVGGTSALTRQIDWGAKNYSLAQRDLIWNRGLAGWQAHPVFGLGLDNYGAFSDQVLEQWVARAGKPYVAAEYAKAPHAHSVYINTLVERGIVGLFALLALLTAWSVRLVRSWPGFATADSTLTLWLCSAAAWLATIVIGFANTTLHHEHAMLAILTLALATMPRRARPDGA